MVRNQLKIILSSNTVNAAARWCRSAQSQARITTDCRVDYDAQRTNLHGTIHCRRYVWLCEAVVLVSEAKAVWLTAWQLHAPCTALPPPRRRAKYANNAQTQQQHAAIRHSAYAVQISTSKIIRVRQYHDNIIGVFMRNLNVTDHSKNTIYWKIRWFTYLNQNITNYTNVSCSSPPRPPPPSSSSYDRINVVQAHRASGPRYKVNVTHVVSVRRSRKTDTSSTQYGMMRR